MRPRRRGRRRSARTWRRPGPSAGRWRSPRRTRTSRRWAERVSMRLPQAGHGGRLHGSGSGTVDHSVRTSAPIRMGLRRAKIAFTMRSFEPSRSTPSRCSVVASFTRMGLRLRRRLFAGRTPSRMVPMAGRTVVLTGPTSGLGRAAAGSFARMGARLVLVGRDAGRLEPYPLTSSSRECRMPQITTVVADMAVAGVGAGGRGARSCAHGAAAGRHRGQRGRHLPRARRSRPRGSSGPSRPWCSARSCWSPRLAAAARGEPRPADRSPSPRAGMYTQALPLDDLASSAERTRARAPTRARSGPRWRWCASGRAGRPGLTVNAMHPGWADTPGLAASLPGFSELIGGQLRTRGRGHGHAPCGWRRRRRPRSTSGRLFLDRRVRPFDRIPSTRLSAAERAELWDRVVALTGEAEAG